MISRSVVNNFFARPLSSFLERSRNTKRVKLRRIFVYVAQLRFGRLSRFVRYMYITMWNGSVAAVAAAAAATAKPRIRASAARSLDLKRKRKSPLRGRHAIRSASAASGTESPGLIHVYAPIIRTYLTVRLSKVDIPWFMRAGGTCAVARAAAVPPSVLTLSLSLGICSVGR